MRQSLDDLGARIRALESANPDARGPGDMDQAKVAPAEPPFVSLQRKWSEIRRGISKARVDVLLGRPERVMLINGDVVWYYVYPGLGRGSVFFDGEEKVSDAQPPRLGWSW